MPIPNRWRKWGLLIFIAAVAIVVTTTALGQFYRPVISVEQQSIELGKRARGSRVSITFTIKNVGRRELVLEAVTPGCACTVAGVSNSRLSPGESAEIALKLDTLQLAEGRFTESVGVATNDPNRPHFQLTFGLDVFSEFLIDPVTLDLGVVRSGSRLDGVLVVQVAAGVAGSVTGVSSVDPGFAASVRPGRLTSSFEVLVSHLPSSVPGPHFGMVRVTTSSAALPEIFVPVRSFVGN